MSLADSQFECKSCHKTFYDNCGKNDFCSKPCYWESLKNRAFFNCKICGKQIEKPKSQVRGGICSRECFSTSQKGPRHSRRKWTLRSASAYPDAEEVYGRCCRICMYDRVIEYAHIVPFKLGGVASPANIIPLCPNHHRLFDKGLLTEKEKEDGGLS